MAFQAQTLGGEGPVSRVRPKRELRALPAPEPSAGIEAYERERALCLAADPRKRANYQRYMASARRSAKVDYLPIKLDIENVSRCNFRCTMCVVSDWPKGRRADDMPLGEFKRLIDEQYGLVEIKLQGIGEPLMQGADYFDMIEYARSKHIWVRVTTNASLLHLKDNYRRLVDTGVNEIQISIDGADKETFEAIRRGSVFERVVENCKKINAYCREKGIRVTKMWTVVQRGNRHQLFDLVDLARGMGFRDQTFAFSLTNWGLDEWRSRNDDVTVEDTLSSELGEALRAKGEAEGIRVSFWNTTAKYSTRSKKTLCPWPFERAVVSSDLRTVPCCTIGNPDAFEIGRGAGKSFGELWQAKEYEDFRQAHLDGEIPAVCRGCYESDEGNGGAAD